MKVRLHTIAACLAAAPVLARAEFVGNVPNGASYSCLTCHAQDDGSEGWNDFGHDVLEAGGANPDANPDDQNAGYTGPPTWSDLCDLDSDGDGYDNDEELGDPQCAWVEGDPDPAGQVTNPGDAQDFAGDVSLCAAPGGRPAFGAALPLFGLWLALGAVQRGRPAVSSRSS